MTFGPNWLREEVDKASLQVLRRKQAVRVMPMIGPLLDAFEGLPNDVKGVIEEDAPALFEILHKLNEAMED